MLKYWFMSTLTAVVAATLANDNIVNIKPNWRTISPAHEDKCFLEEDLEAFFLDLKELLKRSMEISTIFWDDTVSPKSWLEEKQPEIEREIIIRVWQLIEPHFRRSWTWYDEYKIRQALGLGGLAIVDFFDERQSTTKKSNCLQKVSHSDSDKNGYKSYRHKTMELLRLVTYRLYSKIVETMFTVEKMRNCILSSYQNCQRK